MAFSAAMLAGGSNHAHAFDLPDLLSADLVGADWLGGQADAFAGVDAGDSWLFSYGGFTLAPGALDRDGWRVRLYAGSGYYSYTPSGRVGSNAFAPRRADVFQLVALAGWQFSAGVITAKLFAGVAYEDHAISPADPDNAIAGTHIGAKVAAETWFDLARWAWLSADASYATTIDSYSGALKLGFRPVAWVSLGPEASVFGNREFDGHRLGAFARWHCSGCDVTVSGGLSGDYDEETGAYGALSFYSQF
jgi:hypothetical protein